MQPYSIPENCDFNQIIKRGFGRDGRGLPGENPCSPDIHDLKFVGIVINAPKEIRFSSTETEDDLNAIPVCGVQSHDAGTYIDRNGSLNQSLIFVVTDIKANATWSGRIPGPQNLVPQPKPLHGEEKIFTREEMKGRIIRQRFNPNLFNITSMVLRETEYIVYATVGPYKSNVVTIKAIKERK
ncbi:MAG: hypothetical protein HY080_01640 [Gammaproteobacteria bacterium]|nr:hypothetical protein [Gammaproteobacteria bacterium]